VLLHLVDVLPPDPAADPVKDARAIVAELKKFSAELGKRERWLVLNKLDLLSPADGDALCKDIVRRLRWKGPLLRISAATGAGTRELVEALMTRIEEKAAEEAAGGQSPTP
jgi:GTP-binding protein